jgi:uncharacterized UBP type Zn finger protein
MAKIIDEFNLVSSKELRKKRTSICDSCDLKEMMWGKAWCGECGCNIGAKVFLRQSECPLGKWKAE